MAVLFANSGVKTSSTYRNTKQLSGEIANGVEPYKSNDEITDDLLAKPFNQITDKLKEIYYALARGGVNVR